MSFTVADDGFDFKVVIADDRWVVRIPRREQVVPALEREVALLPELAAALPVEVPRFEHVSLEPPFVVYPFIVGTPLRDEDSDGVRAFLEALHGLRTTVLPPVDWVQAFRDQCKEFERLALPLLDVDERPRALALFAEVESLVGFEPVPIHGDLGSDHLLVRGGKLAGVIDWGDARLGDPALDYSWLLHEAFPGWDVDDELRRRARFYHRLAPFYSVHYGVFREDPAYVDRAISRLRTRL